MTMNPLPPQAYTKETLLKAYQWLMGQNTSLKEMATTPDILVSLFLKATRDGDHALERPSIINFKNELKSLAGMMTELDKKEVVKAPQAAQPQSTTSASVQPVARPTAPEKTALTSTLPSMPSFQEPSVNNQNLDSETLSMIHEVKVDFNLSCEQEALRMLVKIGFVRAKTMLKT